MTQRRQPSRNARPTRAGQTRARGGVAARELSAARKKKRQREVMRNRIIFGAACLAVLLLLIFGIVKLITGIIGANKVADTSTLTFKEDGSVVLEEITDFDGEGYSKSDLKKYTEDIIDSFNETYGEKAITLDKVTVKGDQAYMKTTYSSAEAYSAFTSYTCYNGTVENAADAGYTFDDIFAAVVDGVKGDTVDYNSAGDFAGYNVIFVQENVNVVVPGQISYVSNNSTSIVDGNTVAISQDDGNADAADLITIIY
ncbi:MAG: hypothetical protein K6E79_10790 [Pseudobutyrivibrio sp.]|nr:hypothetical protein [Pseudobutyrivibrio sp.]